MRNGSYPIIIAEAGVNHNGNPDMAFKLIDEAARAGADYVKFQTFKSANLVTKDSKTAEYQKENCKADSQFKMLSQLELPYRTFVELAEYCKKKGIGFLSTPFDLESIDFLENLGMDYFKIPSGEITDYPYLNRIAKTGIPVIISTGMAELWEIKDCLDVFYGEGYVSEKITLLHCTTQYPTPLTDVNLLAMHTLHKEFGLSTGYSDHTRGIEVSIAAAALGASVIEKHFTLSRNLPGPDHKASIEPGELKQLVESVRNVSLALGSREKKPAEAEKKNISVARKSIVASRFVKQGELFSEENLTVKRPGNGISPMKWKDVIGKKANHDFFPDDFIEL